MDKFTTRGIRIIRGVSYCQIMGLFISVNMVIIIEILALLNAKVKLVIVMVKSEGFHVSPLF